MAHVFLSDFVPLEDISLVLESMSALYPMGDNSGKSGEGFTKIPNGSTPAAHDQNQQTVREHTQCAVSSPPFGSKCAEGEDAGCIPHEYGKESGV